MTCSSDADCLNPSFCFIDKPWFANLSYCGCGTFYGATGPTCTNLGSYAYLHLVLFFLQLAWAFVLMAMTLRGLTSHPWARLVRQRKVSAWYCLYVSVALAFCVILQACWIYNTLNLADYYIGANDKRFCRFADLENWSFIIFVTGVALGHALNVLVYYRAISISKTDLTLRTVRLERFSRQRYSLISFNFVLIATMTVVANINVAVAAGVGLAFNLFIMCVFAWILVVILSALRVVPARGEALRPILNVLVVTEIGGVFLLAFAALLLVGYLSACQFPTPESDLCSWAFHGFILSILISVSAASYFFVPPWNPPVCNMLKSSSQSASAPQAIPATSNLRDTGETNSMVALGRLNTIRDVSDMIW